MARISRELWIKKNHLSSLQIHSVFFAMGDEFFDSLFFLGTSFSATLAQIVVVGADEITLKLHSRDRTQIHIKLLPRWVTEFKDYHSAIRSIPAQHLRNFHFGK